MKISDLQSQVDLNKNIICYLEYQMSHIKDRIVLLNINNQFDISHKSRELTNMQLAQEYKLCSSYKKKIKQYAKLQRALKSELAYRIQCNRVTREVEALTQKAKTEGWEVLVVDDTTYNQMRKGE